MLVTMEEKRMVLRESYSISEVRWQASRPSVNGGVAEKRRVVVVVGAFCA